MWVDAGTEFKGSYSTLFQKKEIEIYKIYSERKSAFAGKKYTIAQEFDIQVFRGQVDIFVY